MDNRVVSVIASKKRKKKKKPRPDSLQKLPEVTTGVSGSAPAVNEQTKDKPNPSTTISIPQLTITPPDDDSNPCCEVYTPPEVNILGQSSSKRKKKKKKPPALPVVKDEVRPSVVLGYCPRSLCRSVNVQPTVSELEEVCEESETQVDGFNDCSPPQTDARNEVSRTVHEVPEEDDNEDVSLNSSESAYGSVESGRSSCISELSQNFASLSKTKPATSEEPPNGSNTKPTISNSNSSLDSALKEISQEDARSVENHNQELVVTSETSSICSSEFNVESKEELVADAHHSLETVHENCDLETKPPDEPSSEVAAENNQTVIVNGSPSENCSQPEEVDGGEEASEESVPLVAQQHKSQCSITEAKQPVSEVSCEELDPSAHHNHLPCATKCGGEVRDPPIPDPVTVAGATVNGASCESSERAEVCSASTGVGDAMPELKTQDSRKTKAQMKDEKKSSLVDPPSNQAPPPPPQNDPGAVPSAGAKPTEEQKTKAQLKAERKAAFEASKGSHLAAQKVQSAQKSKAELRAERRSLQETQRASKDPGKATPEPQKKPSAGLDSKKPSPPPDQSKTVPSAVITIADPPFKKHPVKAVLDKDVLPQKMRLFSHLPQFQWDSSITADLGLSGKSVHPAIIRAGLKMAQGLISGSDARCVSTLAAFRQVILDYTTPPKKELSRDLDSKVKLYREFLNRCRPLSVSMANAIKHLRWHITNIPSEMEDEKAKERLCKDIDDFVREQVILSKKAIADFASEKIHNNNVILIYGCSPLVKEVLSAAREKKKEFKVIVVDARPGLDGREMVRYLVGRKIECSYVLINAVSYVMKEVDLVLLDCHSLQANGYVMSRVGSSQIALVAQASNVPVLVCCETYKFCDKVNTDAFVDNELGNPGDLVSGLPAHKSPLQNWRDMPYLNLVNMTYDVTPADLVTAVVTELCTLPCTSVPVVLRVKHRDIPK